jgi:hypothetical protein
LSPTVLTLASSWGAEEVSGAHQPASVLDRFVPPYDLTSDLLFVAALAPAAPLHRAFPQAPFLTLGGRALLVMWFSRITGAVYGTPEGKRQTEGGPGAPLYHELNVVALLRRRAFFVLRIYATSVRTILIAYHYGMPKQLTRMSFDLVNNTLSSSTHVDGRESFVRARLLKAVDPLPSALLPVRIWPALFPFGSATRPLIQAVPQIQIARVDASQLDLGVPWLPQPVSFLPYGLYLPNQCMQLPPPGQ